MIDQAKIVLLAIGAALVSFAAAILGYFKLKAVKAEKKVETYKKESANEALNQLQRAEQAARNEITEGQDYVEQERNKAITGDRSHFE